MPTRTKKFSGLLVRVSQRDERITAITHRTLLRNARRTTDAQEDRVGLQSIGSVCHRRRHPAMHRSSTEKLSPAPSCRQKTARCKPTMDARATLRCTTLHYNTLRYTKLHDNTLHYTTPHHTTLHYTTRYYTTLHYTTRHYITTNYITTHYTTLHCTTLRYATLHYTALIHYTTLQ